MNFWHSNKFKISAVIIVILTLALIAGLSIRSNHDTKQIAINYQNENKILGTKYQNHLMDQTHPVYAIDAQGHMDYSSAQMINKLSDFFANITTFNTRNQYESKRDSAKRFVGDKSFFSNSGFMNPKGKNGSAVALTHFCEQNDDVHVYELNSGEFLVIVDYYEAYNPKTFDYTDELDTSNAEFIVDGDVHHVSQVHQVKGISPNNNNQDVAS